MRAEAEARCERRTQAAGEPVTGKLHGRNSVTVAEWSKATGDKVDTVRARIRRGEIAARDLSAGTGRRPRYRIPMRELRRRLEEGQAES